jgi:hypothetical protein
MCERVFQLQRQLLSLTARPVDRSRPLSKKFLDRPIVRFQIKDDAMDLSITSREEVGFNRDKEDGEEDGKHGSNYDSVEG